MRVPSHRIRVVMFYRLPVVRFSLWMLIFCGLSSRLYADEFDSESASSKDPLESVNRVVFSVNMTLDRWLVKPIAKSYQFVAPSFVEQGVTNFFDNIGEVPNIINSVLQWKWGSVGNSTGRLILNSTVGFVGLIDVAKDAGLSKRDAESFGQTLSVWGVEPGPYLVLPFLGASTLTDTVSLPVDWFTDPTTYIEKEGVRHSVKALDLLDTRVGLLEAEELMSGDRYVFIREAYLQRRNYLVNDGVVEDDFGDGFDEMEADF
jgi:phospholipid-binding lipoprotein MlaA